MSPSRPPEGARAELSEEQHHQLDALRERNRVVRPLVEGLQNALAREGDLTMTLERPVVDVTSPEQMFKEHRPGPRTMVVIEGLNERVQPYLDALSRVYSEERQSG